jgi:hypothetical protein
LALVYELERVYGTSCEHGDDQKGQERLGHHQNLGPPGEDRRVGGAEGRAGVESEEKVVREARAPPRIGRVSLGHLREQEIVAGVGFSLRLCAGPPPSISQYHTANVTTLAIQSRAASRSSDGVGTPEPGTKETRKSTLAATATVTVTIKARASQRARW